MTPAPAGTVPACWPSWRVMPEVCEHCGSVLDISTELEAIRTALDGSEDAISTGHSLWRIAVAAEDINDHVARTSDITTELEAIREELEIIARAIARGAER